MSIGASYMAYATIPKEKLELLKRLAHGGFGTVYKAVWNRDIKKQVVAAKRVDKEEGKKELKFLSKLKHPNIVKLLGVVDNKVDVDIILEFCDHGSLRDYLNEHRGKNLGQRFYDWTKQAGRPIAFLKKNGVVHKDVKSPNYLVTSGYILKLCDFGLAKKMDATMTKATESASYPWMAPELLKDNVLSPSYDIFAYGVVVWELWTTDIPFEEAHVPSHLVWRICEQNERPPIPRDCPKQIADLMKQCWETDWKKRPSMEKVLSLLETADPFIAGPWQLVSEFGHQDGPGKLEDAGDIAVCPNGDIAVVDRNDVKVCVYDNMTIYKFNLDLKQGMNPKIRLYPRNVTVNADGIIYVTCRCYVLMYAAQTEYKGRWVAMSPDNKPSDTECLLLSGLTINTDGQLLVGQECSPCRYISKHRQDGSHIASFSISIAPSYIAATSYDTIVISDDGTNTVQIVNATGDVLHTLNANRQISLWGPCGVCCHNDIILVCNIEEISCFSVSSEYLGFIPVKYRLRGVTIANGTSKLLVACRDRAVVYMNK